jgi:hypothetical protein
MEAGGACRAGAIHGQQTDRRWGYTRAGSLIADTLIFQDGATVIRRYEYNRRGQRTAARSTISLSSGTIGEASDSTVYVYSATTGRLSTLTGWSGATKIAAVRWLYDRGGRDTLQAVALGGMPAGQEVVTINRYDAVGRPTVIETKNVGAGLPTKTWYRLATTRTSG